MKSICQCSHDNIAVVALIANAHAVMKRKVGTFVCDRVSLLIVVAVVFVVVHFFPGVCTHTNARVPMIVCVCVCCMLVVAPLMPTLCSRPHWLYIYYAYAPSSGQIRKAHKMFSFYQRCAKNCYYSPLITLHTASMRCHNICYFMHAFRYSHLY